MAEKVFMKGCEAVAETAVRAGCRFFAGYPITPQNDVPEYFARRMPQVGGVFIQGESEVASANMAYGAAAAGVRSMTSSSSCGISLKSEAISWMAGANLPVVIANFQRGGPGIGTIQPAQQDYMQATHASGNGGFRMLVLSPSTLQEAVDMTWEAFELADRYSKPVMLLMDGFTGTMMEPVVLPEPLPEEEVAAIRASKTWAARGKHGGPQHKVMCGPGLDTRVSQAQMNERDAALYESWKQTEDGLRGLPHRGRRGDCHRLRHIGAHSEERRKYAARRGHKGRAHPPAAGSIPSRTRPSRSSISSACAA